MAEGVTTRRQDMSQNAPGTNSDKAGVQDDMKKVQLSSQGEQMSGKGGDKGGKSGQGEPNREVKDLIASQGEMISGQQLKGDELPLKRVTYRLKQPPEGPTLAELRQGVSNRYSVKPDRVTFLDQNKADFALDTRLDQIDGTFFFRVVEESGAVKLWEVFFERGAPVPADIDVGIATVTSMPAVPDALAPGKGRGLDTASTDTTGTFDVSDVVASGSGRISSSGGADDSVLGVRKPERSPDNSSSKKPRSS